MIELTQKPDAVNRVSEMVNALTNAPFIFGVLDCMLFVADAVEAVTGVDVAEDIRGTYYNEQGWLDELKRLSPTGDHVEYINKVLSEYSGVIEGCLLVGSICVVEVFGKQFGGVIIPNGALIFQPEGWYTVKTKNIIQSWGFKCQQ